MGHRHSSRNAEVRITDLGAQESSHGGLQVNGTFQDAELSGLGVKVGRNPRRQRHRICRQKTDLECLGHRELVIQHGQTTVN